MGTKRSKSRRIIRGLIDVILLALCIAFLVFFMQLKELKIEKEESLNSLKNQLNEVKEKLVTQDVRIKDLQDQIEDTGNIDEKIMKIKERYIDVAKRLEEKIKNGESDCKIAYLTFDDGPYKLSERFLDVLDEYNVKGTFFYLKKNEEYGFDKETVDIYYRIIRRIIDSGHVLGNHTASHKLGRGGVYSSVDAFVSSVIENREYIEENFSYKTSVLRFPGGTATAGGLYKPICEELRKLGYCWVNWNSMTGDGNGPTAVSVEESIANVLNKTNNTKLLVVLMHDYSNNTLVALPSIIEGLESQGYVFLPLFNGSQAVYE